MPGTNTTTFDLPQALYSDQLRVLERLRHDHGDNPVDLARSYADLFSRPELSGTALSLSPDLDWESEDSLERAGRILMRLFDENAHVGGTRTPKGTHPQVVALRRIAEALGHRHTVRTVGSGVMVGERVLLTATHVIETQPNRVFFRELDDGQDQLETGGWIKAEPPADLAAVVLKTKPEGIPSIRIANDEEYHRGSTFRSVGFGWTDEGGSTQAVRNHVPAIAVLEITHREIVAGSLGGTACHNDSGGALLVEVESAWALVGVVQSKIADGCRNAARYARVSAYRDELNGKLRERGFPEF